MKFVDKLWKDKDGHQALVEKPNIPLIIWIVCAGLHLVLPAGRLDNIVQVIGFGFLFTWAWLEIYSGKTLLRRGLGVVIMLLIIYSHSK